MYFFNEFLYIKANIPETPLDASSISQVLDSAGNIWIYPKDEHIFVTAWLIIFSSSVNPSSSLTMGHVLGSWSEKCFQKYK